MTREQRNCKGALQEMEAGQSSGGKRNRPEGERITESAATASERWGASERWAARCSPAPESVLPTNRVPASPREPNATLNIGQ
jgi:hypothetical protein